jgi:thiosulfate dehydrogenase [quinone] large subunit
VGVVIAGSTAGLGRAIGGAPKAQGATNPLTPQSTTTTTTVPGQQVTTTTSLGTAIGAASEVPVGGAGRFTLPSGDPGLVLQPTKGDFVAYDAVCPHAGCTVGFSKAADLIACPCHGSEFKVSNGDVIAGPAPHGLTAYTVTQSADGQLYIKA